MLILAVTDGRAGNQRQAEALASAVARQLDAEADHYTVAPREPWKSLAPRWLPYAAAGFDQGWLARLDADRPALVIGCGRQAALATRIARHRLGVATRCVQILNPRLGRNAWDLLVLPEHDEFRDEFTLTCRGSLNGIDADWLHSARQRFPDIGHLPAPRHLLLLGGPTKACVWEGADVRRWIGVLKGWQAARGGSMLLVASPRTPVELHAEIRAACAGFARCWLGAGDGANPYPGALAWADSLLVSPDSANLLSEACATEAPVFLAPGVAQQGRIDGLHASLFASRRLERWSADVVPEGTRVPLRETPRIAHALISRLGLHADAVKTSR